MSHVMKTLNEKWLQSHIFPPSLQLLLTDYMTKTRICDFTLHGSLEQRSQSFTQT